MADEREVIACYICREPSTEGRPVNQPQVHYVECPGCTKYSITDDALFAIEPEPFTSPQRANGSGWLREHGKSIIDESDVPRLRALETPNSLDNAGKLFEFMLAAFSEPGRWYEIHFDTAALRSTAWAEGAQELKWLVSELLIAQLGLLERKDDVDHEEFMVRITPRGWAVLEQRKSLPPPMRPLGFTS